LLSAEFSGGFVKPIAVTTIICSLLLSSLLAFAPGEVIDDACCQGSRGNVNGTGIVDSADLAALVNYLTNAGFVPPCSDAANVNGTGIIDSADLAALVNYLVGGGFVLPACPATTVTDIDGNVYQTVTIGTQVWMKEDLRVTHYRNGDSIPNVTDNTAWTAQTAGAYCEYNNSLSNAATYGRLYNWYAVSDSRIIAPAGWHVASDAEWQMLSDSLGGSVVAGGKLKEAGTTHWTSPNTGATNESGFTALPGGYRGINNGTFFQLGSCTYFWSSTGYNSDMAWLRCLFSSFSDLYRGGIYKGNGFSVRCVKD
jgi:uncharacterized protein (TIGR02145 family)